MALSKVFIIGSGLMGSGIGQVCAQRGLEVTLCDTSAPALDKALKTISWSAGKLVEKGKVPGSLEEIMSRIQTTGDLGQAAGADVIVEAVFESLEVKREVLSQIGGVASPSQLVGTNTSAIPISVLAKGLPHAERFLGLHFFSPVPMMTAVEIIRGAQTSDETFAHGREFALAMGKEPIMVNRDVPGFVINRINLPSTMEAIRLVEDGVASVEDIDKGVRLALGRKMGIFETGDMVGLDVTHGALAAMHQESGDERWRPPELLSRKVKAGELGRKAGKGWYVYDDKGNRLGPAQ